MFTGIRGKKALDATIVPTSEEIAFAAGYYEGEGSIQHVQHKNRGLVVFVFQKDPEKLYWMRERFGGSVGLIRRTGVNKITLFSIRICGDRARRFLLSICPYLSQRRLAQIEKAEPGLLESVTTNTLRPVDSTAGEDRVWPMQECIEGKRENAPLTEYIQ